MYKKINKHLYAKKGKTTMHDKKTIKAIILSGQLNKAQATILEILYKTSGY